MTALPTTPTYTCADHHECSPAKRTCEQYDPACDGDLLAWQRHAPRVPEVDAQPLIDWHLGAPDPITSPTGVQVRMAFIRATR